MRRQHTKVKIKHLTMLLSYLKSLRAPLKQQKPYTPYPALTTLTTGCSPFPESSPSLPPTPTSPPGPGGPPDSSLNRPCPFLPESLQTFYPPEPHHSSLCQMHWGGAEDYFGGSTVCVKWDHSLPSPPIDRGHWVLRPLQPAGRWL